MFDKKFNKRGFHPIKGLMILILILTLVTVVSAVVMFLWNAIIPDITGWKPVSFWQAAGLLILFKILFGGFGRGRHRGGRGRGKSGRKWINMSKEDKMELKEKWMNMTHEEKREMKKKWKDYCRGKKD